MAMSCLDEHAAKIQAFDLTGEQWEQLKAENRECHHLRMPCCPSEVVLKKSRRGTRFFAHAKIGPCLTADESEEHRFLKTLVVEVARECGWTAETEVSGSTRSGEQWRADVLATKGNARVAIEIQWSGQVDDETFRRQERYRECGVRGLWLLRQPGFPVSHELPAVCIGGSIEAGFHALLPYPWRRMTRNDRTTMTGWKVVAPMREFIKAAFNRRLRWGKITDIGADAEAQILVAEADCEHCGFITPIVPGIDLTMAGETLLLTPLDLTGFPDLISEVQSRLPDAFDQSHLKVRYSRMRGTRYWSNGCLDCKRLIGDFHLSAYRSEARVASRFPVKLEGEWAKLVEESDYWQDAEPEWWLIPQ